MSVQDEVLGLVTPELDKIVEGAKDRVVTQFGGWISDEDKDTFAKRVKEAGEYRVKALAAKTEQEALDYRDASLAAVLSIETLTLRHAVVGEAKAASIIMETLVSILDTLESVAASVIKVVLKGALGAVTGGGSAVVDEIVGGVVSGADSIFK